MADIHRLDTLIHKYFDQAASPAELAELDCFVATDERAAERFAGAGRIESGLRAHFQADRSVTQMQALLAAADTHSTPPKTTRRMSKSWVWAAAAVLLIATGYGIWHQLQRGGTSVSENNAVVQGEVLVNGQSATVVPNGESIQIGGAVAVIQLTDGSQAEFEPRSHAVLHGSLPGARQVVELVDGGGSFKVDKGDGQFCVYTPLGRVVALGTEFSVQLKAATLSVAVLAGVVEVEFGGKSHLLSAGESRTYAAAGDAGVRRSKEIRGKLVSIDDQKIIVNRGEKSAKETQFVLDPNVRIVLDGCVVVRDALRPDMIVLLQQLDGGSPVVAIRVEGRTLFGLWRGLSDDRRSIILLAKDNEKTQPAPSEMTYPIVENADVTMGGRTASLAEIPVGAKVAIKLSFDGQSVVSVITSDKREPAERPNEKPAEKSDAPKGEPKNSTEVPSTMEPSTMEPSTKGPSTKGPSTKF